MNDKQKIEDLFHNEARVLAMTAKATRCLSMRRGRTATYAESMEELGYAFRGFALGIDLPDFQVSHPEIEVDISADRKARKYVFDSSSNYKEFTTMALVAWRMMVNTTTDFNEAINIYLHCFDSVASTFTAERLWGVNSSFQVARSKSAITAKVLQEIMPAIAKYPDFDLQVYKLFKLIDAQEFDYALDMFNRIHEEHCSRLSVVSRAALKDYLHQLAHEFEDSEQIVSKIHDLEHWAEKHKVNGKLMTTLPSKGVKVVAKI